MQTLDRDEVTAHVPASPEDVYALVADITRTPELSPEIERCVWLDGATRAEPGARFQAVKPGRQTRLGLEEPAGRAGCRPWS